MNISLSIILVNYNTKDLIDRCVKSIIESQIQIGYEIIVVDNGSSYNVRLQVEQLQKLTPCSIQLIQNNKNNGFGKANNQAAQIARGIYLIFLNTDTIIIGHAIELLYSFILTYKSKVIVGPKLLDPDKDPQPSCGPYYSLITIFIMLFLKGDKIGCTRYSPDKITQVDWVSGACFIMLKNDFIQLGGFDEHIFMYMEEIELMHRAQKESFKVYCYPKAQIIHIGAAASGSHKTPVLNIYRGILYLYSKHHTAQARLLVRILLVVKACLAYLFGIIVGNNDLRITYGEAFKIAVKTN